MKRRKLIMNAFILTFATMMIGFVSTSFRVYLSNKIGSEGMGLYQLIMSIHGMTTTISISGIRVTTTRLIAEELGRSNIKNIKSILEKSCPFFSHIVFFLQPVNDKQKIVIPRTTNNFLLFIYPPFLNHNYYSITIKNFQLKDFFKNKKSNGLIKLVKICYNFIEEVLYEKDINNNIINTCNMYNRL